MTWGAGRRVIQGERGHYWVTNDDGRVDTFAMESDYHNGPVCKNCNYSYCEHCDDGPQEDCTKATLDGEFARVDNQKQLEHVS